MPEGERPPWPSDPDSRDGDGSPACFARANIGPLDSGTDLDRIILYVPARILDLAEALAEKAGVPTVQDYCALLLMQALENERVQQKVADFEARRGPLEGLKQIADDPDYLAEWQERSDARPEAPGGRVGNHDDAGTSRPAVSEPITVDIVARRGSTSGSLGIARSNVAAGIDGTKRIGRSSRHRRQRVRTPASSRSFP